MSFLPAVGMSVKLNAGAGATVDRSAVVAVFHRWIREQALADQLMIDVVDYSHVRGGPGVVLACHGGFLSFGDNGGCPGLRYRFRRDPLAPDPFRAALGALANAAVLLEEEGLDGGPRFATDRLRFALADRLRAPNTAATLAAVRESLQPTVTTLFEGARGIDYLPVREAAEGPLELDIHIDGGPDLRRLHQIASERP